MGQVAIIHGPNLANIGLREPEIYGVRSFESYLAELRAQYPSVELSYYQSNHEGDILDRLYQIEDQAPLGVVLNAGALTHSSIALLDCIRALHYPVIEVHISNVFARESFRQQSLIASACRGSISGLGLLGYKLGIEALLELGKEDKQ